MQTHVAKQSPNPVACGASCLAKDGCDAWNYNASTHDCQFGTINYLSNTTSNGGIEIMHPIDMEFLPPVPSCSGMQLEMTASGSKGFRFYEYCRKTFDEAEVFCQNEGGTLAIIKTNEEWDIIENMNPTGTYCLFSNC